MKINFTLLLLTAISFSASSQQWKISGGYSLGVPQGEMKKNIPPTHNLQAGVLYYLPGALKNLAFGLETGIGIYANKRIEQTFQFSNNVAAVVPVNYSSNVFNVNLQTRLNLLKETKWVIPYLTLKGGLYNFFSNITIEDPTDPGGCHALQRENIINDKTLYWSAGGGLQINPALFAKRKFLRNLSIDLSANTIRGGNISYINTKHLMDAQAVNDPEGKPLNVQFVNVSTQEIHEHSVAQVYTSALRMLEFKAGVIVKL
jgi:hypothetical protein